MFKTKADKIKELYSDAVNFVEGKNMTAKEVFEIMYDAKEYSVSVICTVVDKLYADGFIK